MEACDFKSSNIDPCIFISKDLIVLVYVDDCIILAKEDSKIDNFIASLSINDEEGNKKVEFPDKGKLKIYLGINFTRHVDRTIELKQEFLINRIIEVLKFDSKK